MSPREILDKILNLKTVEYLEKESFKYNAAKSQFSRSKNKIRQIIYFEGSKWNYPNSVADYRLTSRMEIKAFPKWYVGQYATEQSASHHQRRVSFHPPRFSPTNETQWDTYGQTISRRYDLMKFDHNEISKSIFKNVSESIVPALNFRSSYVGIGKHALNELDSFDYFMLAKEIDLAKQKLLDMKTKLKSLNYDELRLEGDFHVKFINNWIDMTNIRIDKFFPQMEKHKNF